MYFTYLFTSASGKKIDLGFLIDGSERINKHDAGNFKKCLELVKSLTKPFVISPTGTRVGAIVYSQQAELQFDFNEFSTRQALEAAIDNIKYPNSPLTYDGKGITMASERLFSDVKNDVARVLVVLSSGWPVENAVRASEDLRNKGVVIISIGLGVHYNKAKLYVMASDPKKGHVFTVDFPEIPSIILAIQDKITKGKSSNV